MYEYTITCTIWEESEITGNLFRRDVSAVVFAESFDSAAKKAAQMLYKPKSKGYDWEFSLVSVKRKL